MSKKLIINADDYGIFPEVNRAIENLIEARKLKNVSVLANSQFYEETVSFLPNHRDCSVGIHLNIVEGVALSPSKNATVLLDKNSQFVNLKQILIRWIKSPFAVSKAVELEWRTQIEVLLKDGLSISHADSHQHIHAFPPFWRILTKLCQEYGIPAVRVPSERNAIKSRQISAFALRNAVNISKTIAPQRKIISNKHFLGFKRAGSYGEQEMINDVKNLKNGVTELIVHPSICDGIPYSNLNGKIEYQALSGTKLWKEIEEFKIELLTWAEFSKTERTKN